MKPSFNLTREPWIPVRFHGDHHPRDVSLREALARAPDIAELTDPSPLVTVALHRLLLAICHRVWGPSSERAWQALWEARQFDIGPLDRYLEQWAHRFDLFDEERPFYQVADLPQAAATTVAKLGHEYAAGNNPALFDHSLDGRPVALDPAASARLLVALQSFAVGGLIARLPGDPPSAESSHLFKAAVQVVTGANLFETLVLNLVALNRETLNLRPERNIPAWEAEPPRAERRAPAGLIDLLTWQPRRVLLFPSAGGMVPLAAIMAGNSMPPDLAIETMEPMAAYVWRDVKNQYPWFPVGFRPEEALWRQGPALLEFAHEKGRRAATLDWLSSLRAAGRLEPRSFGLAMFGLSADRAKVFLWRAESLPLPDAYLVNGDLIGRVTRCINTAGDVAAKVLGATRSMANDALEPYGTADRDRVSALVESLAPARTYWPRLDEPFRRLMVRLAETYDTDNGDAAIAEWVTAIRVAAVDSFERAASALETSSRGYRAAALARPRLLTNLAEALKPLLPEPEEAAP